MQGKELKEKVAKKIVEIAKKKAYFSVGKSIPWGVHEVEIPNELKQIKYEKDK